MPGSEDSNYMIRMSRTLLDRGHLVLRLNLRGAGPSRPVCGGQYSAGASHDLRLLFDVMPREWLDCGAVAIGYSVGGAILLKYLGEVGKDGVGKPLLAACSVSAPIDLLGTCRNLMANRLYHAWIFGRMKREALGEGARLTALERANIEAAKTIWEFDDGFTAARNNCSGAADYYARCSAGNFLPTIRVPTLVLAALDDPWVPGSAYRGNYWGGNRHLTLVLPEHGGHVGFYAAGMDQPWCDAAVAEFIADVR
jgi:predicted alpha/beta-fold hydrolase